MREKDWVEPWTFGQGSFGHRCRGCKADDYCGPLRHKLTCPSGLGLRDRLKRKAREHERIERTVGRREVPVPPQVGTHR